MDIPTQPTSSNATDFMLTEYTTLRDLKANLDSLGEGRVNFFLATISGAAVALGLLGQLSVPVETIYFITGAIFFGMMFLGFITFSRMVERTTKGVEYLRGMNRIRRFFADHHPEIVPYLWLSIYDDTPPFGYTVINLKERRWGLTGLAALVGIINSIIVAIAVGMLGRILFPSFGNWSFLIGGSLFFFVSFIQYRYLANRMEQKRSISEIHFPSSENLSQNTSQESTTLNTAP